MYQLPGPSYKYVKNYNLKKLIAHEVKDCSIIFLIFESYTEYDFLIKLLLQQILYNVIHIQQFLLKKKKH